MVYSGGKGGLACRGREAGPATCRGEGCCTDGEKVGGEEARPATFDLRRPPAYAPLLAGMESLDPSIKGRDPSSLGRDLVVDSFGYLVILFPAIFMCLFRDSPQNSLLILDLIVESPRNYGSDS